MYELSANKPFITEEDGINSVRSSSVISKLTMELGVLFHHKKTIPLEPFPETPLGEGLGPPVPDFILFDNTAGETRIIIEVSQQRGLKSDPRKIIQLIDHDDYGILEGFV